jgi:hypothetical protein
MNNSIGFKATDKEFKCLGFQFSLNKKYIYKGEISLCKSGFHFCKKFTNVFNYYPSVESRFFIINYNSENYRTDEYKSVTDEIEFLEEITERNIFFIIEKYNCDKDDFLLFSVKKNNLEIVKSLVQLGANIQAGNNCALKWASENGHLEMANFLVESGADASKKWKVFSGNKNRCKF